MGWCYEQHAWHELKCNVWLFFLEKDKSISPYVYKHKYGKCQLKQVDWPHAIIQKYFDLLGMSVSIIFIFTQQLFCGEFLLYCEKKLKF
jgi:hypothetical protein